MNKHTILIVDEDRALVNSLKENLLLLNNNYTVKTTDNGEGAISLLEQEEVDLMLLGAKIDEMGDQKLLNRLESRGYWLPVVMLSESKITESNIEFSEFGIIGAFKKPFIPEKVVLDVDDIMKKREKTDLIKNFGLPAIMQLIEMEKRTGIITVKIAQNDARIFFKNGKLMDIKIMGLSTEEALRVCLDSLYEEYEINIEYISHWKPKRIDMSLMQMVMEASRISDEKKKPDTLKGSQTNREKSSRDENLATLTNLLNALNEVDSFIIADREGEVLAASEDYNEDVLNSSIYLWIIGDKIQNLLHTGKPVDLVYYRNDKKRLIQRYGNHVIILDLSEITRFSSFKEKLKELLNQLVS